MSELIVDASVALCWFVKEPATEKANRLIVTKIDLVAPSLMLVELANGLWNRTRRKEIEADLAEAGLREVRRFVPQVFDDAVLAAPAWRWRWNSIIRSTTASILRSRVGEAHP